MPITIDNSIRVYGLAVSSLTTPSWAIGGSDRLLVAGVAMSSQYPANPTACKWGGSGGTAMTLVGGTHLTIDSYRRLSMYTLTAPTVQTSTGYVSWASAMDEVCAFFINYAGVDQADPLHSIAKTTVKGTKAVSSDTNPAQPWTSLVCNTANGDKVVAIQVIMSEFNRTDVVFSNTSGKGTNRLKAGEAELDGYQFDGMSDGDATGSTFEFQWEAHGFFYNEDLPWGAIGISLKPAGSSTITYPSMETMSRGMNRGMSKRT